MFTPLSVQREYLMCSSFDPSLDLPEIPKIDRDTASPDEIAAVDKLLEERRTKLQVARDTGNWGELAKQGGKLTLFRFRQINGLALTWLRGEITRNGLTDDESFELAFRLGLRGVENFGQVEVKCIPGQHELVDELTMQRFYDVGLNLNPPQPLLGRALVIELGAIAFTRAVQGVRPLS